MAETSQLLIAHEARITTIKLNRPDKCNALSPLMIAELLQGLNEAVDSPTEVVVLTGAGQAFCSGLDLEHLTTLHAQTEDECRCDSENMALLLRRLYEFPKPVIAAVNGPAIAAGMSLATLADFTLAAPEAKFGFNEVRVGFVPAIEASFLLRQIGDKRTRDLLLTGRLMKPTEAMALGLVTQIVAAEELQQAAHALAQTLLQNSPQAMQCTKALLARSAHRRLNEEMEDAIRANALHRSGDDFREGVSAFKAHRKPCWPSKKSLR
ncbi:enoyl-CoA hydratase/isomerase family protein [Telmatobacter bradus]|uniref:enoyl-CoA hydratase/isomerase family protein n=1 Tax=Telmatobacter bradus TaxID=474953 RepID=UPI003B42C2D4